MSDYLNFEDIAKELGIPLRTVYHLNKQGRGPKCHKIGRTYLVSRENYGIWLQANEQA